MSDHSPQKRIGVVGDDAYTAGTIMPSPPILDTSHLERQVQGDEELRDELLRLYVERLDALAPKLGEALDSGLREAAHALKGASLAIGAAALAQICGRLEAGASVDGTILAQVVEATRGRVGELLRR